MNLANKLTLSRIALTFALMFFLFTSGLAAKIIAFIIFSLACLTDYLDGYFARKRNLASSFGMIMDPIADKVLVLGSFLAFVEMRIIPAWMVAVVALREFMVTGVRMFALGRGKVLVAKTAGKHKTMSQMLTIFLILSFLIFKEAGLRNNFWNAALNSFFDWSILSLMTLTVILTTTSGISHLWQNRDLFLK